MSHTGPAIKPTPVRHTPLLTKLNLDWEARYQHTSYDFGGLGVRVAGELFDEIRSTKGAEQDHLLYSLLTEAHAGNTNAERVLVQVLLPAATRMANRVRRLDEFDRYDRIGYAIAAGWETIRTYNLKHHGRIHANLTLGTLRNICGRPTANDVHIADRTETVAPETFDDLIDDWEEPAEARLLKLFTWAVDTSVVTRDEVALLARASLSGKKAKDVAAELGITVDVLRHKVYRIRDRISVAVRYQYCPAA